MRRVTSAIVGTLLALVVATSPVVAWTMSSPERFLAWDVKYVRGDDTYRLQQWLIDIAGRRAVEVSTDFRHADLFDRGIPGWCSWGEIIAWNSVDDPADPWRKQTTYYAMRQWLASSTHRVVLLGSWRGYGVGMTYRDGRWYFVAIFARC